MAALPTTDGKNSTSPMTDYTVYYDTTSSTAIEYHEVYLGSSWVPVTRSAAPEVRYCESCETVTAHTPVSKNYLQCGECSEIIDLRADLSEYEEPQSDPLRFFLPPGPWHQQSTRSGLLARPPPCAVRAK